MKEKQRGKGPEARFLGVAHVGKMLRVVLTDSGESAASEIDLLNPHTHLRPDPERDGHYIFVRDQPDPEQPGNNIATEVWCSATIPPSKDYPIKRIRSVKEVQEVPDPNYKPNPVLALLRRILAGRREVLETWETTTASLSDGADSKFEDYSTETPSPRF